MQGARSDYLTYGVENKFYALLGMKPYPEGAERVAINQAFANLFQTISVEPTERGDYLLASRRQTEGPVASRRNVPRLSELSNPLDSLKYATLQAKAATKSKPARFYTNEHGMAVLTLVASKIFKQNYTGTDGLTFTRQQILRLVDGLRQNKNATLGELADALDATIAAHPGQKAFWLVDATGLTADGFERWEASARYQIRNRCTLVSDLLRCDGC